MRRATDPLTVLDVLPEDPELGVVFKCDKAALSGGAHLSTSHNTNSYTDQSEEPVLEL